MKKIRLIPLAALLVAIMLSAFTVEPLKVKGEDEFWFYIDDIPDYHGDQTHYVLWTGQLGSCTGEGEVRCMISAPDDGGYPDLSNEHEETFRP